MIGIAPPATFDDLRRRLRQLSGPDEAAAAAARARQAQLTKPPGSLGRLEELAIWLAAWQGRDPPALERVLVLVFAVTVIAAGVYSMFRLPIDAVPDVTPNQVLVLTQAPGLGPVEVERFVTFPVETAMSGLPGIQQIRSVSRFGLSSVYIYFEEGMDLYFVRRLVLERLPAAREAIPSGIGTPEMGPISTGLGEIYQFEVRSKPGRKHSLMELREVLDWQIAYQLRSVPGVIEVNTSGGELRAYEVRIDPRKLHDFHLPRPGMLVHAHDPEHFRRILESRIAAAPPWMD